MIHCCRKSQLALVALISFAVPAVAQEVAAPVPVTVGETHADSLGAEDVHAYEVRLESGQFVIGDVDQLTVDVVVTVKDPAGEEVGEFDSPARGPEPFQFATDTAGAYTIEVAPFEKATGRYVFALERVEPEATTPEGKVDQLMTRYGDETPGVVVAVVEDGEIAFARAYGMADLTWDIPMTLDVRNNIGSTSKQFTAFAILLLAQRGQLSLDDDVRKYIEELPDFGDTITIRNLLTHTSGYREFLNAIAMTGRRLDEGDYIDRDEIIAMVQRQPELQNAPGAEWNYNNTAFALAAMIVARVGGLPFDEWMRENVFLPLGMEDTFVRPHRLAIIPRSSRGYGAADDGGYRELIDLGGAMGAGGIYTTMADLARWMGNLQTGAYGGYEIIEQMTTPYVLTSGDTTSYGLGLFVDEFRGLKRIQHGGADAAHRSHFAFYPELGTGVLVHSNYAGFDGSAPAAVTEAFLGDALMTEEEMEQVAEAEAEVAASEFDPEAWDPERFDDYAGRYELEEAPGFVLTFSRRADSLFTQATGQEELRIYATSDSTFELRVVDASVTFHRGEDGEVTSLTLHQNGDHPARRLDAEPWEPGPEELAAYEGRYFSDEMESFFTAVVEDGVLVLKHRRVEDIDLTPGEEDRFTAGFPLAEVVFLRSDDGELIGFEASNNRTRGVWFEKQE